jgi:hypothetical protein
MIDIIAGIKQKIKEFTPHLQYVDYHTFGETIIFGLKRMTKKRMIANWGQ